MPAETDHEARFKLAEALARNPGNVSAAARAAGYNRRQVYRVKDDPEFVRMLEAAKARLVETGGAIVSDEDGRAAKRYLLGVTEGREEGDQHRVAAAKALLAAATGGKRAPAARVEQSEAPAAKAPSSPMTPGEATKRWRVV